MKLNSGQLGLHWRLWKRVTAVLFPDSAIRIPKSELDAKRHALYRTATGKELSLTEMNNADFDKVKGAMLAIIEPGNLNAQLHALAQVKKRALWRIDQLLVAMGKNRRFAEGVAQQIQDGIDPNSSDSQWQHERTRTSSRTRSLAELSPVELKKVMSALRSIQHREAHATIAEPQSF